MVSCRRTGAVAWLVSAAVLNAPFLLCHPGWTLLNLAPVRSLAVGLVLLLVPGIPWVGVLIGRQRSRHPAPCDHGRCAVADGTPSVPATFSGFEWLWAVVASLASLLVVLIVIRTAGLPLSGSMAWNGVWLITNATIVLQTLVGGPALGGLAPRDRRDWLGGGLFLAAYAAFFLSATRIVPPMEDHDFDAMGCAYGLLTRFEPLLVSDHDTIYQFSHPPLAYFTTAGSFLYFNRLDDLAYYDAASRRAKAARQGTPFEPFGGTVGGLSGGTGDHRVIRVEGRDYLVEPPLADGSRRIPVWLLENGVLGQRYQRDPQRLAARTPNVFLAALTVALLGAWIGRMSGRSWLALLVPLVYATSPEVFVRSGYGGHFATTNFAVLMVLMAMEARIASSRFAATCLLAGMVAAWTNHKLILLAAAVVLWELVRSQCKKTGTGSEPTCENPGPSAARDASVANVSVPGCSVSGRCRIVAAALDPVVLGFAAGTALFWLWGLSIDPAEFWRDHVQNHFVDRVFHHGYAYQDGRYPSVAGLWIEFWQHTGYVLLPLGIVALVAQGVRHARQSPGLWLLWTLLAATALSLVDWRQTKHLMPLLVPLSLALACWAPPAGIRRKLLIAVLAGLAAWNVSAIYGLAGHFDAFRVTPGW